MKQLSTRVREAGPRDLAVLCRWQCEMAQETESRRLDPAVAGAGVRRALEDPAKGRYWVAERAAVPVGGLMLTREWSDWRAGWFWWIQSVYVEPEARGQGVFRALYAHVEREARESPEVCGLRLYVERQNRQAQAAYHSLGMQETPYRLLEVEFSRMGAGQAS